MGLPRMFVISLAVTTVSFICFLAGYSSNVWSKKSGETLGLWKLCRDDCAAWSPIQSDLLAAHVSRVFCSLALVLLVVHVVFILLFGFKSPVKVFATVAYTCLMIAGILNVFGATTYLSLTAYLGGWVGWGVVLTLLSGVMQNIAAIIMIVPIQQGRVEYTTT